MIWRILGIPERDLSETSRENLVDLLETVGETSQVFPWHSVPQWLFCLRRDAINACESA